MKLYGLILLSLLVLTIEAKYQEDESEAQEDTNTLLRHLNNHNNFRKRLRDENSIKRDKITGASKSDTGKNVVQEPVHIAIFNDGNYDAHLKLNYILNNLQDEQEVSSAIIPGQERDLELPHLATHVRIRVIVDGIIKDQVLIDEQISNFENVKEKCYLLAGNRARPDYGLCAFPFEKSYKLWIGKD